jgi:hypothetical protein
MKFLVVHKTFGGVSYHRLQVPFRFISKLGHEVKHIKNFDDLDRKIPDGYDYLVFNRSMGYGYNDLNIITDFKDRGTKVIMDIDDYWNLPDYHTIVWREDVDYIEWRQTILNNLPHADYIWTSTVWLYETIRKYIKIPEEKIVVARNALDFDEKQWQIQRLG